MSWDRSEPPTLAEEAAHWLLELEEPDSATLSRFAAWLEVSPRHVEEFLLASAVWKELEHVDAARRLDIERLVEEARNNVRAIGAAAPVTSIAAASSAAAAGSAATGISPFISTTAASNAADAGSAAAGISPGASMGAVTAATGAGAASPGRARPGVRRMALAAAAVGATLLVGVALWQAPRAQPRSYTTVRGEQRALKLEDGSVVYLNTQSRVEVAFSKEARVIRLLEGEAMFNVEHDAARPFRVLAGPTVIQAIGTRFNVYRSAAGATVSVVEGVVQISPQAGAAAGTAVDSLPGSAAGSAAASAAGSATRASTWASARASSSGTSENPLADAASAEPHRARVSAGEQARILADGEILTRSVPDLAQIVSWRERRLVFRAERLEDVATQFNRYNAVQILVEDEDLRGKQITGVFDADDPRSFIQFLQRDSALTVEDGGREIAIRRRPDH